MKAIIVDDEPLSAAYLEQVCQDVRHLDVVGVFTGAEEALNYLKTHPADLALMDIEMPGITGMQAVSLLRAACPGIGIIFVTGYEQYAMEAFRADAVSYLLKPCDVEELTHAVEKASKLLSPAVKRIVIQTFGPFDVFLDGQPYRFANRKAKELLALAVDRRGGEVQMEHAVDLLWEGRAYDDTVKQLYRKAVIYLNQLEEQYQIGFFVSNRGSCHVVPDRAECDYFRLLMGDPEAKRQFCGEYMSDYSWGEETLARLDQMFGRV